MSAYYLDTSAWIKRYCREPGSRWVRQLFRASVDMTCATLGLVELVAALARKVKGGGMSADAMQGILVRIDRSWPDFWKVDLIPEVLSLAMQAARKWALRGADAVHLGSALFMRTKLVPYGLTVRFVTSDHELRKAAEGEGFETIDPEEAEASGAPP